MPENKEIPNIECSGFEEDQTGNPYKILGHSTSVSDEEWKEIEHFCKEHGIGTSLYRKGDPDAVELLLRDVGERFNPQQDYNDQRC